MSTCSRIVIPSVAVLLVGLSAQVAIATAAGTLAKVTPTPGGFITPSDRRAPGSYADKQAGLVDALCAIVKQSTGRSCPPSVRAPTNPPGTIKAELPHLRLNIILREIRNVVVSGSGVTEGSGLYSPPEGYFKISSTTADYSLPLDDGFYMLPLPAPNDPWSDMNAAVQLFGGLIVNGCMGAAATFDLALESSVFSTSGADPDFGPFGSVKLSDTLTGHGYYNFKYTIRATDPDGNQSDFIFSGDADSFCTAQSELP